MTERCPIDFNHNSSEHGDNWVKIYQEMREKCPVAWTEHHGGYWVSTRYQDIVDISQKPQTFTSNKTYDPETGEFEGGIIIPGFPGPRFIPDETDEPEWGPFRRILNRPLAPKSAEARRPIARKFTTALLDRVIEKGRIEFVEDLTNPLPALVTLDFLGFPLREWKTFADTFHRLVYLEADDPELPGVVASMEHIRGRITEEILKRRDEPQEDLLTYLATTEIDGKLLDEETYQQIGINVIAGGVGTTTALATNALRYLSANPKDRQRLIDDPSMLPIAREEFVRYYTPIHGAARNVKSDVEVNGQTMSAGERVWLAYASANRDPEIFEDPETVKIDRFPNRHIGFGAGMHRCVGSFLARVMFEEMITQVLERMPDFHVIEDDCVRFHSIAEVNGWIAMPATFTPGERIGPDILP